jgi:hypothetical protein
MLTVETGAGLANAESYCTVAFADQYHADRANDAWAALTTAQKEAYLRRATEYMLAVFRTRWKGERASATQALDWPRLDVVVDNFAVAADYVPIEVQKACALLALKAKDGELDPDVRDAAIKSVTVGPLSKEYFEQQVPARLHRSVSDLLRPFLNGGENMVRLVRA